VVGAIGYAIDRLLDRLEAATHRRRPGAAR
jgi:sulfonate transport system permease protein